MGWLVNASYDSGRVTLYLVSVPNLQPVHWSDPSFRPYYLAEEGSSDQVKRTDLFTQEEKVLARIAFTGTRPKPRKGWELEVDPALSYAYDRRLRFGTLHRFENNAWAPISSPSANETQTVSFRGPAGNKDALKHSLLLDLYSIVSQPVPRIEPRILGLRNRDFSEGEYYKAWILSRLTNLPLPQTYGSYKVSDWIRGMLNSYYRAHSILIPNSDELRLGSTKQYVTGALTITPESGTYFNMVVLDFESLYPGVIDVNNLSYETVRCPHPDCQDNLVPGLDYHICRQRRGIYSAMVGALRDLRIHHFKLLAKTLPADSQVQKVAKAANEILKLLLVSSYGVTIRIRGLASPLLGEAITAYGRYVLQSTFDMAKERGLKPRYGDTDSVFLDNPTDEQVQQFTQEVQARFGLELAYERRYSVCVLSSAKKAYFGILPEGGTEVKGLTVAKSNSPRFFLETFQKCLDRLSAGRMSPGEFERAKGEVQIVVKESLDALIHGHVPLKDLEYRVELREDPRSKFLGRSIPQPYQAALLQREEGRRDRRGGEVGFVKVHPFQHRGRTFTVKPLAQTRINEVNVEDYVRNLTSSLAQTFEPMGIRVHQERETSLSEFTG